MKDSSLDEFPFVELIVLSRNRLNYLIQMIDSLKAQDYPNYKIIISDNSTNDEVANYFKFDEKIELRQRQPPINAHEHFRTVCSEITANYFMILHDDDFTHPHLIRSLISGLKKHSNCSAATANAYIVCGETITRELAVQSTPPKTQVFMSLQKLAENYLSEKKCIFPFPAYMYQKKYLTAGLPAINSMGLVSDVIFLHLMLMAGPFYQVAEPLFYYRIHAQQSTHGIKLKEHMGLQKWFIKNKILSKENKIYQYARLSQLSRALKTKKNKTLLFGWSKKNILIRRTFILFASNPDLALRFIKNKITSRFRIKK